MARSSTHCFAASVRTSRQWVKNATAPPPGAWIDSARMAGLLDRLQVRHRRAVQDVAFLVEARAVAGAVPRLLRVVPGHDAAQVGADGRALVLLALLVAVERDLL